MSLRWRIALLLGAIAALVGSGAAIGSYITTAKQLDRELDRSLTQIVDRVNPPGDPEVSGMPPGGRDPDGDDDRLNDGPGGEPGRAQRCPTAAVQPSAAAQLVRADGSVVACYEDGLILPVDAADRMMADAGGSARLRTVRIEGHRYRMISVSWHHGGIVQAARAFDESDGVLARLRWRLAALVLSAVLAAAVAGWWFAGRIVRPVERLRAAAERVASTGDLSTTVPAVGPGEVGSLAASFTTMMAGLTTSREQQKRLVADASHELRTPLTSLRTNVELLERADRLPEGQRRELLRDVRLELDELSDLVSELVELATDRSGPEQIVEPVRLAEVAEVVAARSRRRSGRRIEVLSTGAHPSAEVLAVRPLLERAVSNLVENAVKYSPSGTPIQVVVDGGRLEVRDRGPGIDPVDRPHVFERFYRSTAARTSAGSGLGLSIVQQIVERHGGRVWADAAVWPATAAEPCSPGQAASGAVSGAAVGFELPVVGAG